MHLIYKNRAISKEMSKAIESLTDSAKLFVKYVKFDQDNSEIVLPIKRYESKKRGLISSMFSRGEKAKFYKSTIIIRSVDKYSVTDNTSRISTDEITILFGLVIKNNNLLICLAEEYHEVDHVYFLNITVSDIDIEIIDEEKING
jgi:hypothetical protein